VAQVALNSLSASGSDGPIFELDAEQIARASAHLVFTSAADKAKVFFIDALCDKSFGWLLIVIRLQSIPAMGSRRICHIVERATSDRHLVRPHTAQGSQYNSSKSN